MEITEEQKNVLVNHFSDKGFVAAFRALIDNLRMPVGVSFSASPKSGFHEEAMSLLLAKGTHRAFESLLREVALLEKEAFSERQVQSNQA